MHRNRNLVRVESSHHRNRCKSPVHFAIHRNSVVVGIRSSSKSGASHRPTLPPNDTSKSSRHRIRFRVRTAVPVVRVESSRPNPTRSLASCIGIEIRCERNPVGPSPIMHCKTVVIQFCRVTVSGPVYPQAIEYSLSLPLGIMHHPT